jgi:hypothetical protein
LVLIGLTSMASLVAVEPLQRSCRATCRSPSSRRRGRECPVRSDLQRLQNEARRPPSASMCHHPSTRRRGGIPPVQERPPCNVSAQIRGPAPWPVSPSSLPPGRLFSPAKSSGQAASLAAERQKAGQPIHMADTQNASIPLAQRVTPGARNVRRVRTSRYRRRSFSTSCVRSVIFPWREALSASKPSCVLRISAATAHKDYRESLRSGPPSSRTTARRDRSAWQTGWCGSPSGLS